MSAALTRELLGLDAMTAADVALDRISRAIQKATGRSVEMSDQIARAALAGMQTCGVTLSLADQQVAA
jgi:hypothetical protein